MASNSGAIAKKQTRMNLPVKLDHNNTILPSYVSLEQFSCLADLPDEP